jgi:prepilin peptidase CpaA
MTKAVLIMLLVACAFQDFVYMKISNVLTAALAVLFGLWAATVGLSIEQVLLHTSVALAIFVAGAVLFRFSLVGGGDVKLLAVTGLWAGPALVVSHLVLTSFLAAGILGFLLFARRMCFGALGAVMMPALPALQPGAGVPYGAAIAVSAILLIPNAI